MSEGIPKSNTEEEHAVPLESYHFQAEMLAGFRESCEHESGHHPLGNERIDLYKSLHKYLDNLEDANFINKYEEGTLPTIASINLSIEKAREALLTIPGDADAVRIEKLFQGQHGVIRNWCKRYVNTIITFHVKKNAWQLLNGTDQRDAFVQADEERRRVHNALLDSLTRLNGLFLDAAEYSDFVAPPQWSKSTSLPPGSALHSPLVFSPSVIADRDFIKGWAIAANSVEEIKRILESDELPPT